MFQRWQRKWRLWRAASLERPFDRVLPGGLITTTEIGDLGERIMVEWLTENGRKVLSRNFASPEGGEVDIVCRHGNVLSFVEVKTRTRVGDYRPADAVNEEKRELIRRGARVWLRLLGFPEIAFRFDIAEVVLTEGEPPKVNLIEDAFQMPPGNWMGRGQSGRKKAKR
jgi:putative endonuclease